MVGVGATKNRLIRARLYSADSVQKAKHIEGNDALRHCWPIKTVTSVVLVFDTTNSVEGKN